MFLSKRLTPDIPLYAMDLHRRGYGGRCGNNMIRHPFGAIRLQDQYRGITAKRKTDLKYLLISNDRPINTC